MNPLLPTLAVVLAFCSSLPAGEWMFRLKDAHLQLRQALLAKDADAAWEHVDRSTRQQAGLLAARIRNEFDSLAGDKKRQLREKLNVSNDEHILSIQGKDLLVATFFLEAHPHLFVGDGEDKRLKDHGTRMAGPTAIVVHKKTPNEIIVPYRFTTEGHFGGQAMDYRALLKIPSLNSILGEPRSKTEAPSARISGQQAVAVFRLAQKAFAEGDIETFWSHLDCDSQSQADHFADQAQQRAANSNHTATILERLGIDQGELDKLDGRQVWTLRWSLEELAYFTNATNPTYISADQYDKELVPVPIGYKRRGKPHAEPMIEFESGGRKWQIPARLNYRNGKPEIKLFIRPPFYLRLRK